MITVRALDDAARAEALLRQLRNALDDATFFERLARAKAQGYRVIAAFDAENAMHGVLGYRIADDLCWGRTFYVDDLVVDRRVRGQGYGAALMKHACALAAEDCDHMRLCSGLSREEAHRFYETHRLERKSYQFVAAI